jgi:signal-transduction protein with cAMP-binding, CBS, and nucleotidyltransferase domain
VIECPACGFTNIEGADNCEQCHGDLAAIDAPENRLDPLGQRLLTDSILELNPAMCVTVLAETSVAEVVRTMCDQKASAVMVMHHDDLVGVFTERDFLNKIADRYTDLAAEPIRKFMSPDPDCLRAADSIAYGLNRMAVRGYRHIPILGDEGPVAMVRTRDVLHYLDKHKPATTS